MGSIYQVTPEGAQCGIFHDADEVAAEPLRGQARRAVSLKLLPLGQAEFFWGEQADFQGVADDIGARFQA
jgi:hypothetical protein